MNSQKENAVCPAIHELKPEAGPTSYLSLRDLLTCPVRQCVVHSPKFCLLSESRVNIGNKISKLTTKNDSGLQTASIGAILLPWLKDNAQYLTEP